MRRSARFLVSLFGSGFILALANVVQLWRIPCCDFIHGYGFPVPFFLAGGFGDYRKFVLSGVILDAVVLLALAAAISWGWKKLSPPRSVAAAGKIVL